VELSLDGPQAELVRELLDRDLRDLRFEIADTDNSSFKGELREREELLRTVLAQLGGPLPDA
jgi:hypothetical protein